jgi:hypothetical protein
MAMATSGRAGLPGPVTRRAWIAGVLGTGFVGAGPDDPAQEIEDLKASLKKAGIERARILLSTHYLAIGNGTERFLRNELADCEAIAQGYFEHFHAKGFDLKVPTTRMSIVALATFRDFEAYFGRKVPAGDAAYYNRESNRLVVFLGRSPQEDRGNLTHEATHQLTFNTGLLEREGNAPKCIIEGFGCYGEYRNPDRHPVQGLSNFVRLDTLKRQRRLKAGWIPLVDLFLKDDLFIPGADRLAISLAAYAEGWLLVHHLMNDPSRLPGFRNYLAAIKGRRPPAARLADAKAHLGDLATLDADLKLYRDRLLRASP